MEARPLPDHGVDDLEARVQQMLHAPAACAFLLVVARSDLTPSEAARPSYALYAAAMAVDLVDVRRPAHDALVAELLEQGGRHEALARALLTEPDAAWWFAPLDPRKQVWVSAQGVGPDPDRFVPPSGPVDGWDCHAQKPREGFYTSTLVEDVASVLAAIDLRVPDFDYRLPSAWWRIECDASARIFEVDGPGA